MSSLSRREFVSCSAHLALAAAVAPRSLRELWARRASFPVVAAEPFGRLERVADGVWALISTPLSGDRTTLSNGGLIAGRNGVLAVEGFMTPAGATWLARQSRELTGQWPTHVVVTHYHADHANGVAGYLAEGATPVLRATMTTRELVVQRNQQADDAKAALADAVPLDATSSTTLDLGGRTARVVPRGGHTPSDVTIELDEPDVVFTGDLVWNAMFPNYVDAIPSRLARDVRSLRRSGGKTAYVPGHGAMAADADIVRYQAMIDEVERAARAAHAAGTSAKDAGAAYQLPASLGEWALFNKAFFARAFEAWYRELDGAGR